MREWDVLVKDWDTRLFQMSKWDLLIRGWWNKNTWNERVRCSRQGLGHTRLFQTSNWDFLIRGWWWKENLKRENKMFSSRGWGWVNVILKTTSKYWFLKHYWVILEEDVWSKRDFLASKRAISSILCQCRVSNCLKQLKHVRWTSLCEWKTKKG